jgi:hypothetical protein
MPRSFLGEAQVTPAAPPAEFTEETYKQVVKLTLQVNDHFEDLRFPVDADGDFTITDVYGTSDGPYSVLFRSPSNRAMSSAEISNVNAIGTAQMPVPFGSVTYPAGGQISLAVTNKHNAANAIEIVLDGIKRRRAAGSR